MMMMFDIFDFDQDGKITTKDVLQGMDKLLETDTLLYEDY